MLIGFVGRFGYSTNDIGLIRGQPQKLASLYLVGLVERE